MLWAGVTMGQYGLLVAESGRRILPHLGEPDETVGTRGSIFDFEDLDYDGDRDDDPSVGYQAEP